MSDDKRRFRKIYLRLWRNPAFRALSDANKVMVLYLLSGPQTNRVGLFHLSMGSASEDLNAAVQMVRKRVSEVCAALAWQYDGLASVIWVPSWWTYNVIKGNPQNFQGALEDLHELPPTCLLTAFCQNTTHIPPECRPLLDRWALLGQRSGSAATQEKEKEKEKEKETPVLAHRGSHTADTESAFTQFRDAYPVGRRVGGKEARRAFDGALNAPAGPTLEALLAALEQHKRSEQWQTSKLIPLLTTWLHQERWRQVLPESRPTGRKVGARPPVDDDAPL